MALVAGGAAATTYIVPSDYGVAAIELATGKVVWRRPGSFTRPELRIEGATLVAEDPAGTPKRQRRELDPATGKVVKRRTAAQTPRVQALAPLPVNLRTASGVTLAFDPHNTRHIETADGKVLKRLDWFPSNLTVHGDVVIFTRHDGKGGNEIDAWDLTRGRLAWEIELDREVHDPSLEGAYVDFAVDGDRLYVSVDQRILAFDINGPPQHRWTTALPRQPIRVYDVPWTTFAVEDDFLFALVYEDLAVLRTSDGALLWTFDGGMLGRPWPLLAGGKVFVSYRAGEVDPSSWSTPGSRAADISALEVRRVKRQWTITPITRAAIPPGAQRWSILRQPAPPARRTSPLVLTLTDSDGDAYAVDLTGAGPGPHVVTFHGYFHAARLRAGSRTAASASW